MVTLRGAVSLACVAVLGSAVFSAHETPRKGRKGALSVEADIMKYVKVGGRVVSSSGRYYRAADGRVREDIGSNGLVIDLKARTVTHLSHETRQAHIVAVPLATTPRPSPSLAMRIGDGLHEGRRITRSRVQGQDGGKGEIWLDEDLGLVVMMRTQSANLVSTRILRNITLREPDSSVFAVPSGYAVGTTTLSGSAALDILARKEAPGLFPRGGGSSETTGRR